MHPTGQELKKYLHQQFPICEGKLSSIENLASRTRCNPLGERNTMRITAIWLSIIVSTVLSAMPVSAQEVEPSRILFTNVSVFDGKDDRLADVDVLVEGNKIAKITKSISAPANTMVIDGAGRTLMPGIIEAHNHLMLSVDSASWFNTHDVFYIGAAAASEAKHYLMRGWTTVRDIGGPAEGLRRAIEDGRVEGPRIYNSGPVIGQTSGHGDFRQHNDPHPNLIEYKQPFYEHFSFISQASDEELQEWSPAAHRRKRCKIASSLYGSDLQASMKRCFRSPEVVARAVQLNELARYCDREAAHNRNAVGIVIWRKYHWKCRADQSNSM